MSRVVKILIKLKYIVFVLFMDMVVYITCNSCFLVMTVLLIIEVFLLCNYVVLSKMKIERDKFSVHSNIRNVDYLIIGDICNVKSLIEDNKTFLQIASSNRGLNSAFQIFRHTFSILNENGGTVIFITKKDSDVYSLFDIPYFNDITIKRLHLIKLKKMSRFPLFFKPISSVEYLFQVIFFKKFSDDFQSNTEIDLFCKQRNINVLYKTIN